MSKSSMMFAAIENEDLPADDPEIQEIIDFMRDQAQEQVEE